LPPQRPDQRRRLPTRWPSTIARVDVDRIAIHARGVTVMPFGHGSTLIKRDTAGGWRLLAD
jgi:hypothetical protein